MKDIPRLLPLWLILLLVALLAMCGCRTGGTRLNPNSAGTIIRTSDARPNFSPLPPIPITSPESTPIVMTNIARSTPVLPEPKSAEANPIAIDPQPAGKSEPFTPTISTKPAKLPPIETKLPPKIVEGGCVIVADNNGTTDKPDGWRCGTEDPEIAGPCEVAPEEQSNSTNWVNLFSLFAILLIGAIGFWVVYDMIRDSIQMKKQGAPIKDHLKNLKKPVKGTRASRKKATTKKKTTRKRKS